MNPYRFVKQYFHFHENILLRKVIKNTFWLTLAEGLSKLFTILVTILITRYLGVGNYGQLSFAFAYVSLFSVIVDFGFNTLATREIAKNPHNASKYIFNILISKIVLSFVAYVAIVIFIQFMNKSDETKNLVYISGIFFLLQSFFYFFHAVFRAYEQMKYEALSKILYASLLSIGIAITIQLRLGLLSIPFIYIIALFIALLYTVITVQKKLTPLTHIFDIPFAKKVAFNAWEYALASLIMILYFRIDVTMLSFMTNDTKVGLYSAAYNIVLFMNLIPSVFLPSIFPSLSRASVSNEKQIATIYKNSLKFLSVMGLLLLVLLIPLSSHIITFVYGSAFIHAGNSLVILIFSGVVLIIDRVGIDLLNARGEQKETIKLFAYSAVLNILLNYFLILQYQEVGSALATLLTEIFLLFFIMYKTRRFLL